MRMGVSLCVWWSMAYDALTGSSLGNRAPRRPNAEHWHSVLIRRSHINSDRPPAELASKGRELKAPTRGLTTRAEAGYREK